MSSAHAQSQQSSGGAPRRGRGLHRALALIASLVLVAMLLVALLPTLISWGLFHSFVTSRVGDHVNGTVEIKSLSLGWGGPLRIEGLKIDDAEHHSSIDVTVQVEEGLWRLLAAGTRTLSVSVAGEIRTRTLEDGSLAIAQMAKPPSPSHPDGSGASAPKDAGAPFAPGANLHVDIGPLALHVDDPSGGAYASITGLKGKVVIVAGGATSVELAADAAYLGSNGSVRASATAPGLVAADGHLAFKGVPLELSGSATRVGFTAGGQAIMVESASIVASAKDMTESLDLAVKAAGRASAATAGAGQSEAVAQTSLDVQLKVAHPLNAAGEVAFDIGGVQGTVLGRNIPTAPLQGALSGTPIVLARDVGAAVDLDGSFASAAGKDIAVTLKSPRLRLTARGEVDAATQAAKLGSVAADMDVQPELLEAWSIAVSGPSRVSLNASDVVIPPRDAQGNFPVGSMEFRATLAAVAKDASVRVEGLRRPLGVSGIQVNATARPVGKGVDFAVSATQEGAGAAPMSAKGTIIPGGKFGVHGQAEARAIPTLLVQPWLGEGVPVRLDRDVGATIERLSVSAGAGLDPQFSAELSAPGLALALNGTQAPDGSLLISKVQAVASAMQPERMLEWGVRVDAPVRAEVTGTDIRIPSPFSLGMVAGNARVAVAPAGGGSLSIRTGEGDQRPIVLRSFSADVRTARLREKLSAVVDATVGGIPISARGECAGLLNAASELALDTMAVDLGVRAESVNPKDIQREVPSVAQALESLGSKPVTLEGHAKGTLSEAALAVRAAGEKLSLNVQGALHPNALDLDASLAGTAPPALVAALCGDSMPFRLYEPAQLDVKATKVRVPRTGRWDFSAPTSAQVALTAPSVTLDEVAGVQTPVRLAELKSGLTVEWADGVVVRADSSARVHALLPDGSAPVACVAQTKLVSGGAGSAQWSIEGSLTDVNGPAVEALLGMDSESRGRIGTGGSVRASLRSERGGALVFSGESKIDQFQVNASGDLTEGVLTLKPSTVKMRLPGPQVLELLNGTEPDGTSSWADAEALDLDASITSLRLPVKRAHAEPQQAAAEKAEAPSVRLPQGFSAVASIQVQPLTLTPLVGQPVRVQAAQLSASAPGIGQPAKVNGRIEVTVGKEPQAGSVALDATLREWTAADGSVAFETMRVDGGVAVSKASTALLGVLMGWGNDLEEAVGPTLSGEFTVASTGPGAGTVKASVQSQHLQLQAPGMRIEKGFVVIPKQSPLTMSFQPSDPLRERLLEPINPIFTDVSLADPKQPIVLEAKGVHYPLDGNYNALSADLQLRVGAVHIRPNQDNQLLNMLKVFQTQNGKPVDGMIEPLNVEVRKGQLQYQNFNVNIEKQGNTWVTRLIFSGDIDLTRKPPFARAIAANYPMGSLARQVLNNVPADEGGAELQDVLGALSGGALDVIQLRVSFSGPLGEHHGKPMKLKRKIKVELKPAEIGKGLGDAAKGVGDILKGIFDKQQKGK